MKDKLKISYSYTEAALAAIDGERADMPAGADGFMTYRCTLHMLFHPQRTYLVTEVGMFWPTEVVSVCANNHVWFCTMDEWKKKLTDNPDFHAAQIFDPLNDPDIKAGDDQAIGDFIKNQQKQLKVDSKPMLAEIDAALSKVAGLKSKLVAAVADAAKMKGGE